MNLDRVTMRTLYVLGLAEKPPLPHELRRIVEGLRSGKSFDPIHIAVVIESLYAAYVSGKLNNTEDLPHRTFGPLQSDFGSKLVTWPAIPSNIPCPKCGLWRGEHDYDCALRDNTQGDPNLFWQHAQGQIEEPALAGDEVSAADQSASLTHKSTSGASNDT